MPAVDFRANKAKISGETVNTNGGGGGGVSSVSGQAVRISGETVKAEISGQLVAISGSIDARISGQTVSVDPVSISGASVNVVSLPADHISGQKVAISGETIYLTSGRNSVQISGQSVRVLDGTGNSIASVIYSGDSVAVAQRGLATYSMLAAYDEQLSGVRRLRVTASGVGGLPHRLMVTTSGDKASISGDTVNVDRLSLSGLPVTATVETNISGQTVRLSDVSGFPIETVVIDGLRYVRALISGQPVTVSVTTNISGQPVRVSGEVFYLVSGQNNVQISGQTVNVDRASLSGLPVTTTVQTNISGQPVRVSGETFYLVSGQNNVQISGQLVAVSGRIVADVSGNVFYLVSGNNAVQISGQMAAVSGQPVRISGSMVSISGQPVRVSGETFYLVSGQNVVQISGQLVAVSGRLVAEVSGQLVAVSGRVVADVSGNVFYLVSGQNNVQVSGQTVNIDRASISGLPADISGQTAYIGASGSAAATTLANTADGRGQSNVGLITNGFLYGFDQDLNQFHRLRATTSGNPMKGRLIVSISGEPVQISGQTVSVDRASLSGLPVTATVETNISGQPVRVSGETIYLVSGRNSVQISGQFVQTSGGVFLMNQTMGSAITSRQPSSDNLADADIALTVISYNELYDPVADRFRRARATASGAGYPFWKALVAVSGETVFVDRASLSGLPVTASIETNISGQTVRISGQTVDVNPTSISGLHVHVISGDMRVRIFDQTANIGMDVLDDTKTDDIDLSANSALTAAQVHGFDGLSGWTRIRARGSGLGFLLVDVSGQPVNVSGNRVVITAGANGDLLPPIDPTAAQTIGSTNALATAATIYVKDGPGGSNLRRVENPVSGRPAVAVGNLSGIPMEVREVVPTSVIISDAVVIASVSGGTSIGSGVIDSISVRVHVSASGMMWLGGVGSFSPNSGKGFLLARGEGRTMRVSNINALRAYAQVSGDTVSFIGDVHPY